MPNRKLGGDIAGSDTSGYLVNMVLYTESALGKRAPDIPRIFSAGFPDQAKNALLILATPVGGHPLRGLP